MKTNSTIKSLVSAALLALPFALLGGCSSGGSGGVAPTSTTTPGYTIKAVGANGGLNGGSGGSGGYVYLYKELGANDVSISKSGTANASFTTTAYTADLGTNPANVTTNTTMIPAAVTLNDWTVTPTDLPTGATTTLVVANNPASSCSVGDGLPGGTPYTVAGDTNVYISGSGTPCGATVPAGTYYISSAVNTRSLYIASGNTTANSSQVAPVGTVYMDGTGVARSAYASDGDNTVADAILPAGTPYMIGRPYNTGYNNGMYVSDADTTAVDPQATGLAVASGVTLTLGMNDNGSACILYFNNDVRNSGTITTIDAPNVTNTRGNLEIDPNTFVGASGSSINLAGTSTATNGGTFTTYPNLEFLNAGSIDTSGADSSTANGGTGGNITIQPWFVAENTGAISANGGKSTFATGAGGDSGYVGIWDYYGHVYNSGAINTNGGDGVASGGVGYGTGMGSWYTYDDTVAVINSGNISAVGGSASAGSGGQGGRDEIYMDSTGAELVNSGNLIATGGATTDNTSSGGYGGTVYLDSMSGYSGNNSAYVPAGQVSISGNIDISGGAAVTTTSGTGSGGSAGDMYVYAADDATSNTAAAVGTDGALQLLGYSAADLHGGSGNSGGSGGEMEAYAYAGYISGVPIGGANLSNEADVNVSGGSVPANAVLTANMYGGSGGYFYMETDSINGQLYPKGMKLSNSGTINANAGDSLGLTTYGYGGGYVYYWGENGLTNTGAISANGSNDISTAGGTVGYGGYGGEVDLENDFNTLSNSGALAVNGGNGTYAGDSGGYVYLYSSGTVVGSGSIAANGGNADATLTGSTGGGGGDVYIESYLSPSTVTGAVSVAGGTGKTPGTAGYYYKQ